MTRTLFAFLLLGSLAGGVHAQALDDLRGNSGAFYRFAEETDVTIEVKVWGAVQNPGLYEVRQGLTLSTLFSLAGGPQFSRPSPQSSSTLTVRLFRQQPQGSPVAIFQAQMIDEILVLDQDPALLHGDMLIAEERVRQRFSWRDGLSIVTAVGTLVLVAERIIRLSE